MKKKEKFIMQIVIKL